MKYVVCVPDGCADEPIAALGGRTPLEAASMPTLARLAARGEVGRAAVIPPGMAPGSDVGNMAILGYDPAEHHTGRAPIEAAALGLRFRPDQVAYRCNLVTIGADGTMVDFAGGHPSTEAAAAVIAELDAELGSGAGADVTFHAGVQYRHIVVAPASWADAACAPPHDLSDRAVEEPTGPAAAKLQALMEASRPIVGRSDLAATQVWLWGQGFQPVLPSFRDRFGLSAGLCTAVDLIRGLGVLTGIEVVEVPGATGWYDTDYEAKRDTALRCLADGADLFLIHVEATDEAGHAGNLDEKLAALEAWDRRILADLVTGLDAIGPWRMLLLPDHPTPVLRKTHTTDPVPYLLVDSAVDGPGGVYSEPATAGSPPVPGHELMGRLVGSRRDPGVLADGPVAPDDPVDRWLDLGTRAAAVAVVLAAVTGVTFLLQSFSIDLEHCDAAAFSVGDVTVHAQEVQTEGDIPETTSDPTPCALEAEHRFAWAAAGMATTGAALAVGLHVRHHRLRYERAQRVVNWTLMRPAIIGPVEWAVVGGFYGVMFASEVAAAVGCVLLLVTAATQPGAGEEPPSMSAVLEEAKRTGSLTSGARAWLHHHVTRAGLWFAVGCLTGVVIAAA